VNIVCIYYTNADVKLKRLDL